MTDEKKIDVCAEIKTAYETAREVAEDVFTHYEHDKPEYRGYVDALAWKIYRESLRRELQANCGYGLSGLLAAFGGSNGKRGADIPKLPDAVAEKIEADRKKETGGDGLKNPPEIEEDKQ